MGIVIKQAGISSILSYLGVALGFVNVSFVFPFFLDMDEFGVRSLLIEGGMILQVIALLGFAQSLLKYVPVLVERGREKEDVYTTFLLLTIITSSLFFLSYKFFSSYIVNFYNEKSDLFVNVEYLLPWLAVILSFSTFFESVLRIEKKTILISVLKNIVVRVLTLLVILLYHYEYVNGDVFWQLIVGCYLFNTVLMFCVLLVERKIAFRIIFFEVIPKDVFKEVFTYSIFCFGVVIGGGLINKLDILMIGGMVSEEAVGIYVYSVFFASLIDVPKKSLQQIFTPILSEEMNSGDFSSLEKYYKQISLNLLILGGGVFVFLWLSIEELFSYLPKGDLFIGGKYVFLLIAIAKLIDGFFSFNSEILSFSKQYYYNLIFLVLLVVVGIVTNHYLIGFFGLNGAAIASVITILFVNFLRWALIKKYYLISPFTKETVYIVLLILILSLVGKMLSIFEKNGLIVAVIGIVVFVFMVVRFKVSPIINDLWEKFRGVFQ